MRRVLAFVLLAVTALAALPQQQEEQGGAVTRRKKVKVQAIPPLQEPLNPQRGTPPSPLAPPAPGPQPAPPGPEAAPPGTGLAAGVLKDKLGADRYRDFVRQIDPPGQPGRGGCGANFRCQDMWFDSAGTPRPEAPAVRPQGSDFFRGGFRPPSESESRGTLQEYKGQPGGGVVLEGMGGGLDAVDELGYDRQFNALVLDGRAVYFIRMPPATFAGLCRALSRDRRIGVSLGRTQIVYGALPKGSDLAFDLMMADNFLGDIVFARGDWTAGYRFAGGFTPRQQTEPFGDIAVFFRFRGFSFSRREREVAPTGGRVDVSLVPLTRERASDGNLLPDFDAIRDGRLPAAFEANARHVAENVQHYLREQIVQRAFVYGEAAALLRWLQDQGADLDELAAAVD